METPARGSSPGLVARMNSVSCCCWLLAGKLASRRKTRVAVPSSPVSSSSGMVNWLYGHCGHVDAGALDVDAAAGAADTDLEGERLRLLVDRPREDVERLDLGACGWCEVGDRGGLQALVGRAAVRPGRQRRGHPDRGHDHQRQRGDSSDHQTPSIAGGPEPWMPRKPFHGVLLSCLGTCLLRRRRRYFPHRARGGLPQAATLACRRLESLCAAESPARPATSSWPSVWRSRASFDRPPIPLVAGSQARVEAEGEGFEPSKSLHP